MESGTVSGSQPSASVHSLRPRLRPATTISPRRWRIASIIVTFRSSFHPPEVQLTRARSSNAVNGSGPSRRRRARTLRRNCGLCARNLAARNGQVPPPAPARLP